MLVHELLRRSAERFPNDCVLLDSGGGRETYAELCQNATRIAHVVTSSGVARGDRVVLALENSRLWAAAYFGILEAGAVVVPLAPEYKDDHLRYAMQDCTPAACVLDEASAGSFGTGLPKCPVFVDRATNQSGTIDTIDLRAAMDQVPAIHPPVRMIDSDLAAIIYTSGSTGTPRGVMLSHLNLTANADSIVEYLRLSHTDRMMVILPFHYVYGLSLLTTHVAVGGSLVIDNRFAFPNAVLGAMQRFDVTGFAGVPSTFALLLHRSSIRKMSFPSLRYVTQAGGPMPPAMLQQWLTVMPNVPFYVMYGATEAAARLAYLDPTELPARIGSIGKAIPNVELRLIKDDGEPAAAGEIGEIVARGSNIMKGYWNRPAETNAALGPHGYRTGDLARCDADGFLYIVGRRQDMLKIGGQRVGAKEIEDVLHEHAAVHEAAVVGMPHELLGEIAVAFVALCPGASTNEADLLAFCRERLADHKIPARVVFEPELPKSSAGKIDKPVLRRSVAHAVTVS
jgi:long-chain acyl-CoA synthetase